MTAALVLAAGAIHLQEWSDLLRHVPTIGDLFLVNVAAAVVVAILLFVGRGWVGIAGAIALSVGTLAGFLLARYGTLLDYSEPRWRTTAVLAAVVEIGAVATAVATIALRLRGPRDDARSPRGSVRQRPLTAAARD